MACEFSALVFLGLLEGDSEKQRAVLNTYHNQNIAITEQTPSRKTDQRRATRIKFGDLLPLNTPFSFRLAVKTHFNGRCCYGEVDVVQRLK